jgi:hypothetical protein
VDYQYEYDPVLDIVPLLDIQAAEPGVMTVPCVSNIFKENMDT